MAMIVCLLLAAVGQSNDGPAEPRSPLQIFRSEFVAITPGTGGFPASFQMGCDRAGRANERPVHRVTFNYSFEIAKYEVPQNLWQAVMGENPSRWQGPRNSAEMLSFDEAVQFCQRATEQMRAAKLITAIQEIRLPSESEWEYAARAATTSRYSFGDDPQQLESYAWFAGNAAGNDPPVAPKAPTLGGFTTCTDTSGNGVATSLRTTTTVHPAMECPGPRAQSPSCESFAVAVGKTRQRP